MAWTRRAALTVLAAALVLPATPAGAAPAPVPDIRIDFEVDDVGPKADGFASAASSAVTFSDTQGSDLFVGDFGAQGDGDRSLSVGTHTDGSGLEIQLPRPTTRISIRFGGDEAARSQAGDQAVLALYRNTTKVAERRLTLNRNGLMDQTISYDNGPLFNRAVFTYRVAPSLGLREIVDRIVIAPLCTIWGTEGDDSLAGTEDRDVICGGGGSDTLIGHKGRDHIIGGNGDDVINGGPDDDYIAGGWGADTLHGNEEDDRLVGGLHDDVLSGGSGNDLLEGGAGTDDCNGGGHTDRASGCETTVAVP